MSLLDLAPLVPALGSIAGLVSGVRFVQESQRGVKLRFGRAIRYKTGPYAGQPKIVHPGFVFLVPSIHSLRRAHVRTNTLPLPAQSIMLADHTVFNVGALVIFQITDTAEGVYSALFEVDDIDKAVEEYCAAVLRDTLTSVRYIDLAEPAKLADQIQQRVTPRLAVWGVEMIDFALTDCSPSPETARMILISAEAEFRAKALVSAAETLSAGGGVQGVDPTVAAALIGTPVSVALGAQHRAIPAGHSIANDEYE